MNPEHARAHLFGFKKLFEMNGNRFMQTREKITHQQESGNRYARTLGLRGKHSWHMHDTQREFTNFGQPLGVRLGQVLIFKHQEFLLLKTIINLAYFLKGLK